MVAQLITICTIYLCLKESAFDHYSEPDELSGDWKILHDEELSNPCSSPLIITMFKSRRIGKNHLESLGIDEGTYLKWTLEK
jgi:hypothetical protein